jgi:hypothetical protein
MKVSFYKNIKSVSPKEVDLYRILDIIKDGTYQELIKNVRLYINNDEKRSEEKKKLPLVGFGGTFSTRGNDNLVQHSGLACLDFDHLLDVEATKAEVNRDKYTLSSFVSPSGDGLKVIVKIPLVSTDKDYKSFYSELQKHYNQYGETDEATKDISRATFLTFDPDLYLNTDSDLFTDRFIVKEIEIKPINVRIDDMDAIATNIITWFNKKWTTGSNRNNNLFVLSAAFNDYGVDISTAKSYCYHYISKDFTEKEIEMLVNSAYKHTANFGSKAFEDKNKKYQIKKMVDNGSNEAQVKAKFGDNEGILTEFKELSEGQDANVFWFQDNKGNEKISFVRFDNYLKAKGISKYFPYENNSEFEFIMKDDNFIDWIDTTRIKDIVKLDLMNRGEFDVWDLMAKTSTIFKRDTLSMLDTVSVSPKRDTKHESFLYYKNSAVRTTKDNVELIDYEDITDVIWRNQIIDRDIVVVPESEGEFKTFIWKLAAENKERYYTLKSVIGYLLHSHQNDSKPKAIIFNDEMISDDVPNGGSGKGLIHKAMGHIKNIVTEDGKKFDPKGQFAYQKVNKDTQIFLMDDVPKNFNFESLFSIVTEGMTVEKKGKDAFQIPFTESPKISITTNYTINGDGASHYRRVFEVEIANHFNDSHTPEDEFGHQFFSDWNKEEWEKYDNFMIRCIQFYLKNGLVESNKVNLNLRKLKGTCGPDFIEFMDKQMFHESVGRKELKDSFTREYPDQAKYNTSQKFNKKVKDYCKHFDYKLEEKQSQGTWEFHITKPLSEIINF